MASKGIRKVLEVSHEKGLDLLESSRIYSLLTERSARGQVISEAPLVTIDPINSCNLKCRWCNAEYVIGKGEKRLSKDLLPGIIDYLALMKVEAVALSGGGEPLMHPDAGDVIERCLSHGMLVAISTNGVLIDEFMEPLSRCNWIGVSIDVGAGELMKALKSYDYFERIIENISRLIDYSKRRGAALTKKPLGLGVMYRFLACRENVQELCRAAEIARKTGCDNFFYRPASVPWHRLHGDGKGIDEFTNELDEQGKRAKKLENGHFKVLGVSSNPEKPRGRCTDLLSTLIIMPGEREDAFDIGLCYDRRGDNAVRLGRDLNAAETIGRLWGSPVHRSIYERLDRGACPDCTE